MAPLLTFYGDDFTGSSAVMEILAFAGVPTTMFLDVPSPELLASLPGIRAFGIAGIARSRSPEWMTAELPRYLEALATLGAPVLHYKTCSTFDSAPHLGSIGRATEIGLQVTGSAWAPFVVGAPPIGRYQVFGTLFAAFDGHVHRLDRHPAMSCHPATPMTEADLCRHLAAQTDLASAVIDWRQLLSGQGEAALAAARQAGARILALDAFDEATLAATGALIWQAATRTPLLAVGSQGVEYALVAHWRQIGLLPEHRPLPALTPAAPLLVVSGSCSQVTARQIAAAERAGFLCLALDVREALDPAAWAGELARCQPVVLEALARGRHVVVHTARGPSDPAIQALETLLAAGGADAGTVHARIGDGLGRILREARERLHLPRAILAGGDTSGHAMLALGAEALEPLASLASGVPLLRLRSADSRHAGMELAFKGGQMGADDLFLRGALGDGT